MAMKSSKIQSQKIKFPYVTLIGPGNFGAIEKTPRRRPQKPRQRQPAPSRKKRKTQGAALPSRPKKIVVNNDLVRRLLETTMATATDAKVEVKIDEEELDASWSMISSVDELVPEGEVDDCSSNIIVATS